jgi:hypothetical protein
MSRRPSSRGTGEEHLATAACGKEVGRRLLRPDVSRAPRLLGDRGVRRVIRTRWGLAAPQSSSVSGQRELTAQEQRAHSPYLVENVFVPAGMPPRARILLRADHGEGGVIAEE